MVTTIPMEAQLRDRAGKGAARATRRAGRVPAVIYGDKKNPISISIDPVELMKQMRRQGFYSHIFEIAVDGETYRTLARDVQVDPVSDQPLHVDFMRFGPKTRLNIEVPVHFENEEESPGIRRGGVLNVVRHTVELYCSPENVPEVLTIDLAGLDIGDGVHISSVDLPEGVRPTITDRDFTIATIAAPTVVAEEAAAEGEEEEELEAAEGEEAEGEEGEEAAEGEAEGEESED